jgi:hypothetical protein
LIEAPGRSNGAWLNLEEIATVEVTSEDPAFPIESALCAADLSGWRASAPGEQRIRIVFDHPVSLHRIELRFHEPAIERTQEFTLRWRPASGGPAREIVRQQWNFSPAGSSTEIEEYQVDLPDAAIVELDIRPDLNRQDAVASLAAWRLA